MIDCITLSNLLPRVFRGMEDMPAIRRSQVWLRPQVELRRGCRVCISAESGGGKSSLLSFIYGNRTDYDGTIRFDSPVDGRRPASAVVDGRRPASAPVDGRRPASHAPQGSLDIRSFNLSNWCELRTRALALLPQELRLFPELSAMENIQIKNRLTAHKSPEQILALLERLGIREKANTPVGRLSIGQQQRVALVRTLCQPFDFIFLDEPVSHLDERNNRIAAQIIAEEAEALGAGIISTSVGHHLLLDGAQQIEL